MLESNANDAAAHVFVTTETNITVKDLEKAKIARFAMAGYGFRQDQNVQEGGGGGAPIYVNEHVPFVGGVGKIAGKKGVLDY